MQVFAELRMKKYIGKLAIWGLEGGIFFVFAIPILKVNLESNMVNLIAKCVSPPYFQFASNAPALHGQCLKV